MLPQNLPTMPMILGTPMKTFMLHMLPTIKVPTTMEIMHRFDAAVSLQYMDVMVVSSFVVLCFCTLTSRRL